MKDERMKVFTIHCSQTVIATMKVEARSLKEAEDIAINEEPFPTDGEYLEGSFTLDKYVDDYGDYEIVEED